MTKNFRTHIKSDAAVCAVSLGLFFGTVVHPCVESLSWAQIEATPAVLWSLAAKEAGQMRNRAIEKFRNFRFVYRLEMQLRESCIEKRAISNVCRKRI